MWMLKFFNVDNVVASKLIKTKIGYLDEVIKPLVLILSKMSAYVISSKVKGGDKDKNTELMSFRIDDDNLLEKFLKTFWTKIEDL